MSIYIDTAFLINFVFDFEIIILTHLICSKKVKIFRILLAAIMGGIHGVIVFLPYFSMLSVPPVNILVSLLLAAIAICPCKIKDFLRFYITFLSLSFCLAGIMFFMDMKAIFGIFLILPAYEAVKKVKSYAVTKRARVCLYLDGKKIEKDALYDSGNSVFYFGKPVIFGNKAIISEFFGKDFSLEEYKGICVIPYKTVKNSGIVLGIRLDKAEINGKSYEGTVLGFFDERLREEIILNRIMV